MTSSAEALRALDKAMTPGPWEVYLSGPDEDGWFSAEVSHGSKAIVVFHESDWQALDLEPIATLRNALPALVDLVKTAEDLRATHRVPLAASGSVIEGGLIATDEDAGALADAEAEARSAFDTALAALTEALDA